MIYVVPNKVFFNRRFIKVYTKLNQCNSILCDLCAKSLRPLRLMDFNFFELRVILFLFFLVLVSKSFSQSYNYRTFTSEDGLAQSFVYSIIQDNNGYLWIGTDNGLSRYNGFVFEDFTTKDSLADNFITCSITDRDGLWFGHRNGRLSYYNGRNFRPFDIPGAVGSPVTHFVKRSDGRIWVSIYSGSLLRLSSDTGSMKKFLFKDQISILTFDFTSNGELLVATNSGLLLCRLTDTGEVEIVRKVTEIPESKVTSIEKMRNNQGFFIATEDDGIYRLTDKDNLLTISKINVDKDFEFIKIQHIIQDSHSDLWVGTFGMGLIKIMNPASGDPAKIKNFNKTNGFSSDNTKTVYEDREGNIWSGNYGGGLTQITPKLFSVFTFDKVQHGNHIFSIWSDSQYRWIGTETGLVKLDQLTGRVVKFYSKDSGLPGDTVTSVYSGNGKELWIGTGKNGLFRLNMENEKIERYNFLDGTSGYSRNSIENHINTITGKGDLIWIGTWKGLCQLNYVTGKMKWYNISQGGLPHNYINSVYSDRSGTVWVTTRSNVLSYLKDEKFFKIPLGTITSSSTLGPVAEDNDSRLWVGSNGNGVYVIESDSIINITVNEGLLSNYCYSLICDNRDNFWVGHKNGLSSIRTTDFHVKPVPHIETITDSYQFSSNAVVKDSLEKIWFGSDKGLISYDPLGESTMMMPPDLGITSLKINDIETAFTDRIVLSPGKYDIRITFLGVSLREPTLVSYQYQLEGYDNSPEITKATSKTYPNLTEGEYKFILYASSGDGAVSDPLTLSIIINTPIWKKWWFSPLAVLILFFLIFIYIKRREYRFLDEKRILEEKVRERTYEIQCQKNEIELQHNMINERNASITSSINYARNIQNAVLPPNGLIDKILPENFIISKPKDIVSGDFYWLAEKGDKIIITVADCTGHGVPGAFMSLLGITFLNEIVNIEGITRSVDIVTKLRERVIHSLQQGRQNIPITDGMDISLCVIDQKQKIIQFTGGMNDLIYVSNEKLGVIKADRISVCALYGKADPFTMKEINYNKGDVFYLVSDGFQDQFGGEFDKKYLSPYFRLTLFEIHKLPMSEQKEMLERKLRDWMKKEVQTDDITVIGIRL